MKVALFVVVFLCGRSLFFSSSDGGGGGGGGVEAAKQGSPVGRHPPRPVVIVDLPRIPGTCENDTQCGLGYWCTEDNFCVPDQSSFPPAPVLKHPVGPSTGKVIAGLVTCAFLICLIASMFVLVPRGGINSALSVCASVGFAAVVAALVWGVGRTALVPWVPTEPGTGSECHYLRAIACEPYLCDVETKACLTDCTYDGECTSGFICGGDGRCEASSATSRKYVVAVWLVVLLTILTCCCCFCCWGISFIYCVDKGMCWGRGDKVYATFIGLACCIATACAVAMVLSLTLAGRKDDSSFNFEGGDGGSVTNMTVTCITDSPCAPYVCSTLKGECMDKCYEDSMCVDGYECQTSTFTCVPGKGVSGFRMRWTSVTVAVVLASLPCGIVMVLMTAATIDEKVNVVNAAFWSVCYFVLTLSLAAVIGTIATTVSLTSSAVRNEEGSPPVTCGMVNAVICEPYFCDVSEHQCLQQCVSDADCMESTRCEGLTCVADPDYVVGRSPLPLTTMIAVILLVGALAWIVVTVVGLYFVSGVEWYARTALDTIFEWNARTIRMEITSSLWCGCFTTFVLAIALALALGVQRHGEAIQPSGGHESGGGRADANVTECIGLLASVCSPYFCDAKTSTCFTSCSSDRDCRSGAYGAAPGVGVHCDLLTSTCVEDLVVPVVAASSLPLVLWALSTGIAVITCVGCARGLAKASFGGGMYYGIHDYRLPLVGCGTLVLTAVLVTVLVLFLAPATRVAALPPSPTSSAGGDRRPPLCSSVHDPTCYPYSCDESVGLCFAACVEDGGCAPGYMCSTKNGDEKASKDDANQMGTCERDESFTGLASRYILLMIGMVAIPLLIYSAPAMQRAWEAYQASIREAHFQALLEEDEQQKRAVEEAKREHSVYIDLERPETAGDPSLPSPGVWVTDPTPHVGGSNDIVTPPKGGGTAHAFPEDFPDPAITQGTVFPHEAVPVIDLRPKLLPPPPSSSRPGGAGPSTAAPPPPPLREVEVLVGPDEWSCPTCTYINSTDVSMCIICQGTRGASQPSGSSGRGLGGSLAYFLSTGGVGSDGGHIASPTAAQEYRTALAQGSTPGGSGGGGSESGGFPHGPRRRLPPKLAIPPTPPESMAGLRRERTTQETCCICYAADSTVRFAGRQCDHGFCAECTQTELQRMVEVGQFPARCPGCRAAPGGANEGGGGGGAGSGSGFISADVVEGLVSRGILDAAFARRFINMMILKAFEPSEVLSCPVCSMLLVRGDTIVGPEAVRQGKSLAVECAECNMRFCSQCNCLWHRSHEGISCEKYAERQRTADDLNSYRFINVTSKKCPGCRASTFRGRQHACHHIRPGAGCPNCGLHWCYACGDSNGRPAPWPCVSSSHSTYCDDRCDCLPCPDCKPNRPCYNCPGDCVVCRGTATA